MVGTEACLLQKMNKYAIVIDLIDRKIWAFHVFWQHLTKSSEMPMYKGDSADEVWM